MSVDIIKPMQAKMVKEVLSVKDDPFFDQLKKEANRLYGAHQFTEAISLYSRIIDSSPPFNQLVVIIANRSQCWLKLGQYHKALEDSDLLIKSFFVPINDPKEPLWPKESKRIYAKALMKRGNALLGLGNRYGALRSILDFERYWRELALPDLKLEENHHKIIEDLLKSPMDQFKESLPCEHVDVPFSGHPSLLIEGKWSRLNVETKTRPKERYRHASVYYEGEIWIFGGRNAVDTEFADMWAYNLSSKKWREITWKGEGPSKRSCAMVVWDDLFYIFGASDNDDEKLFWSFNPKQSKWIRLETPNNKKGFRIPAIQEHRVSISYNRKSMIVFGGSGHDFDGEKKKNFGDLLEYSFVSKQWKRWPKSSILGLSPIQRRSHIQWIIGNDLYVLFGMGDPPQESVETTLEDFWKLDLKSLDNEPIWVSLTLQGNVPEPRAETVATVSNGRAVIFGGFSSSIAMSFAKTRQVMQYNYMGDTLVFTPRKNGGHWALLNGTGERPSNRSGSCLVSDEVGNVYSVFGETNVNQKLHDMNDIHKLDFTPEEAPLKIPPFHPTTVKTSKLNKKTCSRCGLVFDTKLGQCGFKCGTYYCSVDCQSKHWEEGHSNSCPNARDPSKVTNLDEMD